jgi:hypothetical protein
MSKTLPKKATYDACEIEALFGITKQQIPKYIKSGLIPKALVSTGQGEKRLWSKAVIDHRLGLSDTPTIDLRSLVREELQLALRGHAA